MATVEKYDGPVGLHLLMLMLISQDLVICHLRTVHMVTYFWITNPKYYLHNKHKLANTSEVQGAYKLSDYFAKLYFHKYWTEIHDVTTTWKRNVCSFIVTLNAFDVRPTCDMADVQAIFPFPPNPLKHVLCDIPDYGVDALSQFW